MNGNFDLPFRPEGTSLTEDQLLLRKKVLAQIESDPGSFDMGYWKISWPPDWKGGCRTTRCIAGWAVFLAGREVPDLPSQWHRIGVRLLGLTRGEYFGWSAYYDENRRSALFLADNYSALVRMRELAGVQG